MIPEQSESSRLWLGTRLLGKNRFFDDREQINCLSGNPVYVKVEFIPPECASIGVPGSLANQFFSNYWNFYETDYSLVSGAEGLILDKKGKPEREPVTSLMRPSEVDDYCKGWIGALSDFPEDGLALIGFDGSPEELRSIFAQYGSIARLASQLYIQTRFSLPKGKNI